MNGVRLENPRHIIVAIVATATVIFVIDLTAALGVAIGATYVLVVLLTSWSSLPRMPVVVAAACSLLTILGAFLSPSEDAVLWKAMVNRGLSIFAIWIAAELSWRRHHDREQQNRLIHEVDSRRTADDRMRMIVESALDCIITIDDRGVIIGWNPQAESDFGWSRHEALGRKLSDLIVPPAFREAHQAGLSRFRRTHTPVILNQRLELSALRRSGDVFPVELTILPLRTAGGVEFSAFVRDISRQKAAEAALHESEERFHRMFRLAAVGMVQLCGRTARFLHVNQRYCAITGYSADELSEKTPIELDHPDDRAADSELIRKMFRGEIPEYFNIKRYIRKDGTIIWVQINGTLIRSDDNEPEVAIAVVMDVTDRVQAEVALRESEANLRNINAELDRKVQERTAALTAANTELEQAQQSLAETAARLAFPQDRSSMAGRTCSIASFSLTDMMDCGTAIRSFSARPNKRAFADALVRHFYDALLDDQGDRAFALVRMFETQPYSALSPELRTVAASALPDIEDATRCLTLLATAGNIDAWNDVTQSAGHRAIPLPSEDAVLKLPMVAQMLRQLGVEVGGVIQPVDSILLKTDDTGVFHVEDAVGSPFIPCQDDFVIPCGIRSVIGFGDVMPDGRLFAVIMFARVPIARKIAVLFGHLSLSSRIALMTHIDVRQRTESQILALDRLMRNHEHIVAETEGHLQRTMSRLTASNVELEQFAYIASHDLQEPLRKIQAFGDLLVTSYADTLGDEGRDYLQRMNRAAQRMQTLINDLLTLSRVLRKQQPFQAVDLNLVVATVIADLETRITASNGRVNVGPLPKIDADPTQMRQLFQNLIGNGLKYCRPDVAPIVEVSARSRDRSPLSDVSATTAQAGRSAGDWIITVQDNGIGFEPRYANQIFQPFQRLHGRSEYEGTGIGLTICRRIVDRHHGRIRADSPGDVGATFVVTLPAVQTQEIDDHDGQT